MQQEPPRTGGPACRHEHPAGSSPHGASDLEVLHHHGEDEVDDHQVHSELRTRTTHQKVHKVRRNNATYPPCRGGGGRNALICPDPAHFSGLPTRRPSKYCTEGIARCSDLQGGQPRITTHPVSLGRLSDPENHGRQPGPPHVPPHGTQEGPAVRWDHHLRSVTAGK